MALTPAIDLTAVADSVNPNQTSIIVNCVEDAVISSSYAVPRGPDKFLAAGRARIPLEIVHGIRNALARPCGKTIIFAARTRFQLDFIRHPCLSSAAALP